MPNNGNGGANYNVVMGSGALTQDIAPGVTIQQLQMTGGAITLTNPLTLNAGLQFSGGTISNGVLNVAGTSTQSAVMGAAGLTLNNSGTYNFTLASGNLFSGAGAVFNNSGTLARSAGTGVVSFNVPLNNSGSVSVGSGTLQLTAGGSGAGTFSADAGTILRLSSGYTFNSGASWAGAGTIEVVNGIDAHIGGTIQNSGLLGSLPPTSSRGSSSRPIAR